MLAEPGLNSGHVGTISLAIQRIRPDGDVTHRRDDNRRSVQRGKPHRFLGSIHSVDLGKTKVSGGLPPDPLPESRQKAMKWLRVAEEAVVRRHGSEGLGLTRAVLCDRQSVEQTARLRGAETDREVWFWSRLFRRCLDVLAQAFGFRNVDLSAAVVERATCRAGPRRRSGAPRWRG